jgi:hypothetical protein
MIEKDIDNHKESEIETNKSIHIEHICSIECSEMVTDRVTQFWKSVWVHKHKEHLLKKIHWFVKNIPTIEPEKSSEKYPKKCNNHCSSDIDPSKRSVVEPIPVDMDEFQRCKS